MLLWTQISDTIAPLLDSVTVAELVEVRLSTSCREVSSVRQPKQWSAVYGHVTGLLAMALDGRREAARASVNGAGVAVHNRAELAASRAFKLLHLV